MAERGFGRVINILSNTIWDPPPVGVLAYVASKGGLLGFTRALAREVGDSGITVNGVAPGLTRTPATAADVPQEQFDAVRDGQAIKRTLEPGDIAGAVAFLASDDAAMITGQALRVDGGTVTL
jgi:NAD(P)-dependent dehydrogenase (short-subunit alcohol dehydrogenase family)